MLIAMLRICGVKKQYVVFGALNLVLLRDVLAQPSLYRLH